ncbi:MAG TPA: class I SAM-dependent methyltransferase, partial [Acidimicrobiales bacterium]|nr:class I SAM-dependent methyltransferase [Acidimicrobiales bacterium]
MHSYVTGDRNRFAQQLFMTLPQRYDHLAELLSMGQNGRWRRAMIDRIVPTSPARVLDVASGTAGVALQLAERTSADIVGVDLTSEMLARGRHNVAVAGQGSRVQLVTGRGEQLP